MPKSDIEDYDTTAANNTDVGGNDIAENCAPSGINNALRDMMAHQKTYHATRASDVASAATLDLTNAFGSEVAITGTTTVTAVTLPDGAKRMARASSAFQLTAGSSLIVNGSTSINYTTTAGDLLFFVGYASSVVRVWVFPMQTVGTFTPVVTGSSTAGSGSYSTQSGTYTRIGDRVFFELWVDYSGHTGTGAITITGLPLTPAGLAAVTLWASGLTYSGDLVAYVDDQASVHLYSQSSGVSSSQVSMDAAANIVVSGCYRV